MLCYLIITKFLHKYFCIHNSTCACAKPISKIVPIMKLQTFPNSGNNGVVIMKKAFHNIKNVKLHSNLPCFFLLRILNDYIINANAIRECNFGMGTILGKGFEQALMHKSQHLCRCKTLVPMWKLYSCILSKKVVLNFFYHFGVGLKILGLKSSFFNRTVRSGTEKFIFQLDCKVWD